MIHMLNLARPVALVIIMLACGALFAQEAASGLALDLGGEVANGAAWSRFLDGVCAEGMRLGSSVQDGAFASLVKEKEALLAAASETSTSLALSPIPVPPGGIRSRLLVQLNSGKLSGAMLSLAGIPAAVEEAALPIVQWFSQKMGRFECGVIETSDGGFSPALRSKEASGGQWMILLHPDPKGTGMATLALVHLFSDAPPPFARQEILPLSKLKDDEAIRLYKSVGLSLRGGSSSPGKASAPATSPGRPQPSTAKIVALANDAAKGLSLLELSQLRPCVEKDSLEASPVPVTELREGTQRLVDRGTNDLLPGHQDLLYFTVQDGTVTQAILILVSSARASRMPFVELFNAIAEDWALKKLTLSEGNAEEKQEPSPLAVFAPAEPGAPSAYLTLQYKEDALATSILIVVQTKDWTSYGELTKPMDAAPETVEGVFRRYGFDFAEFAKRLEDTRQKPTER